LRPRHLLPTNEIMEQTVQLDSNAEGIVDSMSWNRCRADVVECMYKFSRRITIKCDMDWDLAADFLIRCRSLTDIQYVFIFSRPSALILDSWIASGKLSRPISDTIQCLIAAKSPSINLHVSGKYWRPEGSSSSSFILAKSLITLDFNQFHKHDYFWFRDFSNLQCLSLKNVDLPRFVSLLPPKPLPALKKLRLNFGSHQPSSVVRADLSRLLLVIPQLETLEIICSDAYLNSAAIARHSTLRNLKLENIVYTSSTGRTGHSFGESSLTHIFNHCPRLSEISLEMLQWGDKVSTRENCHQDFIILTRL
jgi:hypothetical protein